MPFLLVVLAVAGCGRSSAQNSGDQPPPVPARPLITVPLSGEKISVLPLTMVVAASPLSAEPPFIDRPATLRWADSLLERALENRAPEVAWVFPADLRAIARRAPTVAPDPDRMGQSIMASPKLTFMPDPLRTYARSLVALAGGRHLLIPAAFTFTREADGRVKADLSIVMTDARNGQVIWRTLMVGHGATPDEALATALEAMLPLPAGSQ